MEHHDRECVTEQNCSPHMRTSKQRLEVARDKIYLQGQAPSDLLKFPPPSSVD
jgi:hypothetical protein